MLRLTIFLAFLQLLAACTPVVRYAGMPPAYGNVHALSEAELRAAVDANTRFVRAHPLSPGPGIPTSGLPVTFVRVISPTTIELHYERRDAVSEHYTTVERVRGRWELTLSSLRDLP